MLMACGRFPDDDGSFGSGGGEGVDSTDVAVLRKRPWAEPQSIRAQSKETIVLAVDGSVSALHTKASFTQTVLSVISAYGQTCCLVDQVCLSLQGRRLLCWGW